MGRLPAMKASSSGRAALPPTKMGASSWPIPAISAFRSSTATGRLSVNSVDRAYSPVSLDEPVGVDTDAQGNIAVADTWNGRVQTL